jgi:hypothetical protein
MFAHALPRLRSGRNTPAADDKTLNDRGDQALVRCDRPHAPLVSPTRAPSAVPLPSAPPHP